MAALRLPDDVYPPRAGQVAWYALPQWPARLHAPPPLAPPATGASIPYSPAAIAPHPPPPEPLSPSAAPPRDKPQPPAPHFVLGCGLPAAFLPPD